MEQKWNSKALGSPPFGFLLLYWPSAHFLPHQTDTPKRKPFHPSLFHWSRDPPWELVCLLVLKTRKAPNKLLVPPLCSLHCPRNNKRKKIPLLVLFRDPTALHSTLKMPTNELNPSSYLSLLLFKKNQRKTVLPFLPFGRPESQPFESSLSLLCSIFQPLSSPSWGLL